MERKSWEKNKKMQIKATSEKKKKRTQRKEKKEKRKGEHLIMRLSKKR